MKNILARIRKDLDTIKADLRDRAGIQAETIKAQLTDLTLPDDIYLERYTLLVKGLQKVEYFEDDLCHIQDLIL